MTYFSYAFDQCRYICLIGEEMRLHPRPMEWIFTLQTDATPTIWSQQNWDHAECWLQMEEQQPMNLFFLLVFHCNTVIVHTRPRIPL